MLAGRFKRWHRPLLTVAGVLVACTTVGLIVTRFRLAPESAKEESKMFGRSKKGRLAAVPAADEPMVTVYLNPLVILLVGRERQKGSPLTEAEVIAVRDQAQGIPMTRSQAEKFYASLDGQMPIPRLDPERIWEEWQEVRQRVE